MVQAKTSHNVEAITNTVNESIRHYRRDRAGNDFLYNYLTVAAITATTLATLLPTVFPKEDASYWPQILTALATVLIATQRTLHFGARWAYSNKMLAGYKLIKILLDLYASDAEHQRDHRLEEILTRLKALSKQEGMIPGIEMDATGAIADKGTDDDTQ